MSDEDKYKGGTPGEPVIDAANRARNRTVMLTPDITGQVRARLQRDMGGSEAPPGDEGFVSPSQLRGSAPAVPPGVSAPSGAAQNRTARAPAPKTPLAGFLVSFDLEKTGEYYELRSGRIIITSEEVGAANHLVINDPTVSPMHAILRVSPSGELQVLDQLSEHGTFIRRLGNSEEEQLSGDKSSLEHGDVVRFGDRQFIVCIVYKPE